MADSDTIQTTLDHHDLTLTRLSKVLYPAARFTKAHVVDYYLRAAPWLLPHLRNRPLTLKRYPDGIQSKAFWEKDAPSFTPDWVTRFPVARRAGGADIHYILANNAATLAWLANIATLEFHPFLHCVPNLSAPTSVVFDLDPGEGTNLLHCIDIAFLIGQLLENFGLQLFPKVSGAKGLQLYLPLNTPVTYATTQPFARSVALLIETQHPDLAVSDMAKHKRTNKVFIDWSQNADFKTTVAVYSLRAQRDYPFVSMPVLWTELEAVRKSRNPDPLQFDPPAALARLDEKGDLFESVLTLQQTLPADLTQSLSPQPTRTRRRSSPKATQPAPAVPRRSAQGSSRRFVVQQHAASRLHYDFRLEMHDALKSWAIPKGVPYEPGVRRLASATEDHPLDYLDFEGIIPQGQYGGGTVMVWDIGTYQVVEGNYWRGYLHIGMAGKKLQGEWKLTRDQKRGKNTWLIEKVQPALQPPPHEDRSALSDRTLRQIAEAHDAVWQSNRTPAPDPALDDATRSLPVAEAAFIEPMQCKLVAKLPESPGWRYEAKFDGYRALVIRNRGVTIASRRNNPLTADYPGIAAACAHLPESTVIDGEIVALDAAGKPAFNALQNKRLQPDRVQFYAFDLLVYKGRSLLSVALDKRRELLRTVLRDVPKPVFFSETLNAELDQLIAAAQATGLEGLIAKRGDSVYEAGKRTGLWSKLKFHLDQELVIGGYVPGPGGFDALLVGYYQDKKLIFCGKIRNGFTTPGSKETVFKEFNGLAQDTCPFDNLPEPKSARRGMALTAEAMKNCCWLKPKLVAQVGIREWTIDGHLRHSAFLGLRADQVPDKVVRDRW